MVSHTPMSSLSIAPRKAGFAGAILLNFLSTKRFLFHSRKQLTSGNDLIFIDL
jgi:hypothetical protein